MLTEEDVESIKATPVFQQWYKGVPEAAKIDPQKKLKLEANHGHLRDEFVFFEEEPHLYFIFDPSSMAPVDNLTSVTTFIHLFKNKFDTEGKIAEIVGRKNAPGSKYYGKTADQIRNEWSDKTGTILGTKLHRLIELFYNDVDLSSLFSIDKMDSVHKMDKIDKEVYESIEFQSYFKDFHKQVVVANNWIPFRSEWRIFCNQIKIVGTIDFVFIKDIDRPMEVIIYDWKRSKEICTYAKFKNKLLSPIAHLDECNFIEYSLQLNLYKYLLEKNYGMKVIEMYLGIFHPNSSDYQTFKIEDKYFAEVEKLIQFRKSQLANGETHNIH